VFVFIFSPNFSRMTFPPACLHESIENFDVEQARSGKLIARSFSPKVAVLVTLHIVSEIFTSGNRDKIIGFCRGGWTSTKQVKLGDSAQISRVANTPMHSELGVSNKTVNAHVPRRKLAANSNFG
jgi:hypothetical protein